MDHYITLFEKFIGRINWKLLQASAVKLNTDYKVKSFFTHHHLASMIYFFFDWAKFRSTKAGIKMHTSIDGSTGIPDRIIFSNAACHDRTQMDELITDKGTIYICDKGYVDYKKFDTYTTKGIYFVSCPKDNAKITVTEELPITYSEEKKWAFPQRLYHPF